MNRNYGIDLTCNEPIQKWNLMKFDIKKCFDSIDNNQIMPYVNELFYKALGNDYNFTIMRHVKVKFDFDYRHLKTRLD